ncbi:curli production assembly/transport component CsgF [uncultured Pontibacter sp.]|uniref:curli production assembly/transport component CsgF n=1 Tax=uncultured Pontibacter sp. TaxID=453356 RepID=UPI0026118FF1|nr:curli production assembly/transport component CsgF [uncultured Pontibacter sp.]
MKKVFYSLCFFAAFCLIGAGEAMAQDFVYQAKNPAFGGDPYNYNWMMNSAQAQDKLKDPKQESQKSLFEDNPLQDFKKDLNRQILSQLSRQLVTSQFGEDGITPGSYTIGSYKIDVTEDSKGINIIIVDSATGDRTSVTIPYY